MYERVLLDGEVEPDFLGSNLGSVTHLVISGNLYSLYSHISSSSK